MMKPPNWVGNWENYPLLTSDRGASAKLIMACGANKSFRS
jgi:hypothetical protein